MPSSAPNPQLDLAFDYVRYTNKNIFLTGKAGTGKTTFLHKIKAEAFKRMIVTAPTGVAAINAGGMTLHSFFQLPFGLFLPGASRDEGERRRFSSQKINLIRSLDLLVIDEVSMVRADLLDAVDDVLRRYRDSSQPFGGAQLLMIGDLHQLPPVVKQEDWQLLRPHYRTPYFFSSLALEKTDPVAIELQHIYRQSDSRFIELLNRVRNNRLDAAVLDALNSRYIPDFQPGEEDYITLTAHNASANDLNARRLESISQPSRTFKAKILGEFPELAYPTEASLEFKKGAQVMFVKNDLSPEKRYFNGKIGRITRFSRDEIIVRCKGEPEPITVAPVEWENIRYSLDEETKEIKEELLGTFTQYPLKLAWAITIHKSQGLTFDRAIIDARAAFAHGQVYVALSRCRSFEGIVLSSRISHSSVKTDLIVKDYSDQIERNLPNEERLRQSKREYQEALVWEMFDFRDLERYFEQMNRLFHEHPAALDAQSHERFKALRAKGTAEIFGVADRFRPQLQGYFSQPELPDENEALRERLKKAAAYFSAKLLNGLRLELTSLPLVTDDKAVLKTARECLGKLEKEISIKGACCMACQTGFSTHGYGEAKTRADLDFKPSRSPALVEASEPPKNVPHPALYARLQRWRNDMAEALEQEPSQVLPTRSIEEIVRVLPASRKSLKQVTGFGASRLKRFGPVLIALVKEYCAGDAAPPKATPAPTPQASRGNTRLISLELYKSGKTIDEIAAERSLARNTIEGHLAHFIGRRYLDILEFLTREQVEEIVQFFTEKNTESTAEAKAHFGERYSYGELTMALEHRKAKSEGSAAPK